MKEYSRTEGIQEERKAGYVRQNAFLNTQIVVNLFVRRENWRIQAIFTFVMNVSMKWILYAKIYTHIFHS